MFKNLIKRTAFTMAEILLSLTIIGVVAAITLPSLTGNINERTWNTQRKALYSRLSQAIALMDSVKGYGMGNISSNNNDYGGVLDAPNAAETFVTNGLGKVMKINNICDNAHLSDCGLPAQINRLGGAGKLNLSDFTYLHGLNEFFSRAGCERPQGIVTKAAAFETANGESILVHYNPLCKYQSTTWGANYGNAHIVNIMCANFVYDLNGKKGPNTIGKDMGFITLLYPTDSQLIAPMPASKDSTRATWANAARTCTSQDSEMRLPNIYELGSLGTNAKFMDTAFANNTEYYWSATPYTTERAWTLKGEGGFDYIMRAYDPGGGTTTQTLKTQSNKVRCIKRIN